VDALIEKAILADGGKFMAFVGVIVWLDIRTTVKNMAKALETLTIQMAAIVERVDSHEKRIDRLEG
jgi:hypothetical protein